MTVDSVGDVEAGRKVVVVVAPPMERDGAGDQGGEGCGGRFMEDWCCSCAQLLMGPNPMLARYLYALVFLVANLLAWTLHDYGNSALSELQRYLASGLMGVYVVFMCWSAIRSEPHTEICNRKAAVATSADWVNIASFVIAVIVIVAATFSTGIDSKCIQFKKAQLEEEDDDIPYGFGFFHFVFAMGAMYFAMIFVGWNAHQTMEKWTIDVGWASTWVRVGNEWLAAIVYVWMMVAPVIWKSRQVVSST